MMELLFSAHSRSIAVRQMYSLGSIVQAQIKKFAPAAGLIKAFEGLGNFEKST